MERSKTEYRIYGQTQFDDGSLGPWEPIGSASDNRSELEAKAERYGAGQSPREAERRNYAVVEVSYRPLRLYLAPMRGG